MKKEIVEEHETHHLGHDVTVYLDGYSESEIDGVLKKITMSFCKIETDDGLMVIDMEKVMDIIVHPKDEGGWPQ